MDIIMGALGIFGAIMLIGGIVIMIRPPRGSKRDEYRDRLRESGVSEEEITRRVKSADTKQQQGKRW